MRKFTKAELLRISLVGEMQDSIVRLPWKDFEEMTLRDIYWEMGKLEHAIWLVLWLAGRGERSEMFHRIDAVRRRERSAERLNRYLDVALDSYLRAEFDLEKTDCLTEGLLFIRRFERGTYENLIQSVLAEEKKERCLFLWADGSFEAREVLAGAEYWKVPITIAEQDEIREAVFGPFCNKMHRYVIVLFKRLELFRQVPCDFGYTSELACVAYVQDPWNQEFARLD